ncbi:hypothetical protein O3I_003955 [Nocardia brasiliensis ATCC 700358]|uniref:DNA sulfur modification protein DndB n=1 Tax=Nocardia brasiliensis (strain ATCC 700358 / HUJEG-1) TaxID=1133849 RepID=K0EP45_NOCB7|nr:hypothetical protein O3I_003955 [Nocardia brasiliensis ATCC 700358]
MQAGREYYVSMCPLRLIPKIFLFDDEELPAEVRAQRVLNKGRLPALVRYLVDNHDDYVFSALTASIDGDMCFESITDAGTGMRAGQIRIPMAARFLINDGQHRRAAIELALRENPDLGDDTIAVVFFHDAGLQRCQQMFADLNRHAVRPDRSLSVLYDQRDSVAYLTRLLAFQSPVFKGHVELETSTLSARSRKLFTLSALHTGNLSLLAGLDLDQDAARQVVEQFWQSVDALIPEWALVRERKLAAPEVRRDFIHSHSLALHAIGEVGNHLLRESLEPDEWSSRLAPLGQVDWTRSNSDWNGRAIIGGRVSKGRQNVVATVEYLCQRLDLSMDALAPATSDADERGDR